MTEPRMSIAPNMICTNNGDVDENNFASTPVEQSYIPTTAELAAQQKQYQQLMKIRSRALGYELAMNSFLPVNDWLSDLIPPQMLVCAENQEQNIQIWDSAKALANAHEQDRNVQLLESAKTMAQLQNTIDSIHLEVEPSFLETLGDIAVGIVLLPFSIAGCSSEDPKDPPIYDDYLKSNGESCSSDDECDSGYCKTYVCTYKNYNLADTGSNEKKSNGELCSSHNDCESGLCDWDGNNDSCSEKRELEEWCTDNYQCASGNCYHGDCKPIGYQAPPLVCDKDKDGHENKYISSCHGDDCNDDNSSVYPGATEIKADGIDENCNFYGDEDSDNDGVTRDEGDCNDDNPNSGPWNNCGGNGCNCN